LSVVKEATMVIDGATERPRWVPKPVAFWGIAATLGLFLFAASAPSPLYEIYAIRWHFSSLTLTIVFALYAVALLAALLTLGRLSDHVGRRPVLCVAISVEIVSMLCFIVASSTAEIGIARILQGLATGGAIGALAATLTDLSPRTAPVVNSAAPTFGLAAGAIVSSALVQYGPAPLRLIYWVILAGLLGGLVLVAAMDETGGRQPGAVASLRPNARVPAGARPTFVKLLPSLIALWALSGFYLSLAPGLAAHIEGSSNLLWGGSVVFALCASGGIAVLAAKRIAARTAMLAGCVALFVGVGLTAVAIAASVIALFLIGSVIAGVGFGIAFLGAFRALTAVAAPAERAGTIAVMYIVSYLAFSVPIVIAGVAETHFSSRDVALVFSGAVAVLAAAGAITGLGHSRGAKPSGKGSVSPSAVPVELTPCPGSVPVALSAIEDH
jgi:Major Facilitator Superfamily